MTNKRRYTRGTPEYGSPPLDTHHRNRKEDNPQ